MQIDRLLNILHIEDDPILASLVQYTLDSPEFKVKLYSTNSVENTLEFLRQCAHDKLHINLILSDMQLPDGSGLDILQTVKNDPYWHLVPVIILSNESDPSWIDAAYEAGAASYHPKYNIVGTIESLYNCWKEQSWPQTSKVDRFQAAIARAVYIRGQASEFYLGVSKRFKETDDIRFWLDRALNEGNLANLLAFLKPLVEEKNAPTGLLNRMTKMQDQVQLSLTNIKKRFNTSPPEQSSELCEAVITLHDSLNEAAIIELLNYIFTISPETTELLQKYAATQLTAIAQYALRKSNEPGLVNKATAMIALSKRLSG